MPGRDRSSRYFRDMDRGSPSGSFEDIEASWSRKPQQFEARRKKEKARQSSMACYHVVVLVFLFLITAGVAYLVYNGTDTSTFLRNNQPGSVSATQSSCLPNPCLYGGVCNEEDNGYTCTCPAGREGKNCETSTACAGDPCGKNGNCTEDPNGYYCTCNEGWTGTRCETALYCSSQPCQHGGVCLDGANGFYCFCEDGWVGKLCETDIDECKDNPCGTNQECINQPGNYTCNCTRGYDGTPCQDVDECAANPSPCHVNATCANTDGSYTCTCKSGFRENGDNCQDIDECSFPGRCPANSDCINTIGSHHCDCHPGYSGPECTETTTTPPPSTESSPTTTVSSGSTGTVTTTLNTFTGTVTTTTAATTTTETTTTTPGTTEAPTTTQPTPVIGWGNGQSVGNKSINYPNGTTGVMNSGWEVDPTIDEEISNAFAHEGQQSWYYKSGTNTVINGPIDKTPFSPGLSVKVGRSDGSYTGEADSFYVSFWFKMAHDYNNRFGDGTRMLVVAGDPNGTAASSNYLEINFPSQYRARLSIRTKESYPSYPQCAQSKNCGDDFGGIYNTIAGNLDPTTWHHVEMTLRSRPQDYLDEWFYVIDGDTANPSQGGAFYKTQQYDEGRYLYVNRVSFVDISSANVNTKKGIYFDDISYKAYNSSDPNLVLEEYSTSFEPVELN